MLQLVEGHIVLVHDFLAGPGILVEQMLDHGPFDERLFDHTGNVLDLHPLVKDALGFDDDYRAPLAESVAAGGQDVDLVS